MRPYSGPMAHPQEICPHFRATKLSSPILSHPLLSSPILSHPTPLAPQNLHKSLNSFCKMPTPPPVHRVAITGGPCAGKTTALAEVSERLRSRGFDVYVVPEAATLFFAGGASLAHATPLQILAFQAALLRAQIALEDSFNTIASASTRPSYILSDRGAVDGRAYMPDHLWFTMLKENGWDMVGLRDARYDLVVHLITAADGAPDFYSLENNKARSESSEEACAVDRRTQKAWVGHPHLRIVDNRTGFREKINRADARISELAGIHLSKRIVRKFLLQRAPAAGPHGETFVVEQTFLKRPGQGEVQESIRKRGKDGTFTYVHKVRKDDRETKRQISHREFQSLLPHRDPARGTVRIQRQCFLHNGNYFVHDTVYNLEPPVQLLRCHCDEEETENLEIPQWLQVEREVTGDREWSMHTLSEGAFRICGHESGKGTTSNGHAPQMLVPGMAKSL